MKIIEASPAKEFLRVVTQQFAHQKFLADNTFLPLNNVDFYFQPSPHIPCISVLIKQITDAFSDFFADLLAFENEKNPYKKESSEIKEFLSKEELLELWEEAFALSDKTLAELIETDLTRLILVNNELCTVLEALFKVLLHLSFEVSRIVIMADWALNNKSLASLEEKQP